MVFTPPAVLESKVNDNEIIELLISPARVTLAEKVEDPVQVLPAKNGNENKKGQ